MSEKQFLQDYFKNLINLINPEKYLDDLLRVKQILKRH